MMMGSHSLAPPPPPPPELIDDAIAEILLHLPPDDPACLVCASLVCKLWHRILSEPTFPDRYRHFHQTPPLLGFLSGPYNSGRDERPDRFGFVPIVATTEIPFRQPSFGRRALDCRHGRVLLDMVDGSTGGIRDSLAVWDPVTGDHMMLGNPNQFGRPFDQSGAVLCAAAGCDHRGCDHRGCGHGGGPFQVVFVSTSYNYGDGTNAPARAWVYSSETASWSTPVSVEIHYDGRVTVQRKRAAIVGDQIYFLLSSLGAGILKYDLGKRCLTVIGSPCTSTYLMPGCMLMTMEDGSLGFAGVDDFATLHLWVTKLNPNGSMGWVLDRVISLCNLPVPIIGTEDTSDKVMDVSGFAEGVDILLLAIDDGRGFMFELKSERFRKLSKPEYYYYDEFLPYLSFCIPDFARHKQCDTPNMECTPRWTIWANRGPRMRRHHHGRCSTPQRRI